MKKLLLLTIMVSLNVFAVEIGKIAPTFSLPSATGKEINLNQFEGKTVVLEWLNHGCPFVRKHYDSGNMQAIQKKYAEKGVVWLSVISSAKGKQGYVTPKEALAQAKQYKSNASHILIDEDGTVGRAFEAKVTPHMYVINAKGTLVYQGAIDSVSSADPKDIKTAKNYVSEALDATLAGKSVSEASTKAYGCGVKYQ